MEKGRNSFEVLCKTLNENTPQPKENNLNYVRRILRKYENVDDLFQIKVEAEADDIWNYTSNKIAINSFFLAAVTLAVTTLTNISDKLKSAEIGELSIMWLIYLMIVGVAAVWSMVKHYSFTPVIKWRKYVLAVIDEIIDEKSNKMVKNKKKYIVELQEQ